VIELQGLLVPLHVVAAVMEVIHAYLVAAVVLQPERWERVRHGVARTGGVLIQQHRVVLVVLVVDQLKLAIVRRRVRGVCN
jgi:hypothetical protein